MFARGQMNDSNPGLLSSPSSAKFQADLPDQTVFPDDPLARGVAQRETVRSIELENERQRDEENRQRENQVNLLGYWADAMFKRAIQRIDNINASLAETVIRYERVQTPSPSLLTRLHFKIEATDVLTIRFLDHEAVIVLGVVLPDLSDDVILWGWIESKGVRRVASVISC